MALAEKPDRLPAATGAAPAPARVHVSVVLLVVAGVLASGWLYDLVGEGERERAEAEFSRRVMARHHFVQQTLTEYTRLLHSVQKLYDSTPDTLTNRVEAAAELLKSQGLPLLALHWAPRVRGEERAAFEAELRRAGAPDPTIRTFTAERRWMPAPALAEYFPRRYSVPLTVPQTLGADFASQGVHHDVMEQARDTGEPRLDTRLSTNQLPTFIFVLPVFPPMAGTDTVAARRASLKGFLLAYVRSADLALALSRFQRDAGVEMLFSAPTGAGSGAAAYFLPNADQLETAPAGRAAEMRAGLHQELVVKLISLPVTFLYRPAPTWLAAQRTLNRYGALASTLLLTLIAAGFLQFLHRRREVVERQVRERTDELERSHAELQRAGEQLRASEQLYHSLVSHLPHLVFRKDLAGRFTFANEAFTRALNRPVADLLGRTDADLFPPELAAKFAADDQRVLATGLDLEVEEQTALGTSVSFVRVSKTVLRDGAGRIIGIQGQAWDITERHQMEAALRASEARFRTFMDNSPAPAWLKDHELRLRYLNAPLERLLQKPADELLGKEDHDFLPPAVADAVQANDRAVLAANCPKEIIEQVPGADGRMRHWLVVKFPFAGPAGQRWVGGIAFEVTGRVEALAALRLREEQMRLFVQHTPAAVAMLDRDMRYLVASRRWLTDYRISEQEIVGKSHYDVFPEIPERWKEVHRRCLSGAVESCEEDPFPRADGQTDWVRWEIRPWHDAAGQIGGIIMFTEVVTERKLARQAIERRDAVLRAVARTANTLVRSELAADTMRTVLGELGAALEAGSAHVFELHVSGEGRRLMSLRFAWEAPGRAPQWEPARLQNLPEFARWTETLARGESLAGNLAAFPAEEQALLIAGGIRSALLVPIFAGPRCWGLLLCNESRHDRDWTPQEADALRVAAGVLGAAFERQRTETERLNIERKMVESQKLESLGVLAGGIAHDFNNLLTSILGNASLLRLDLPPGTSPLHHSLDQIEQTSLRAADLCRQMLAYSGKGRFQLRRVDLARLVEETTHLLQISISKKVVLKFNFASGLPPVEVDPTQLRQIVMNLVINASEAIGERSGLIALTTGLTRVDRAYLTTTYLAPELPEGDYVFLEVSDNGCGMAPEVKARIFDPFFTTKFTGRGLGLAAVLGIVRGHRGALKVYSEPGRGSSFKLILPVAVGSVSSADTSPAPVLWRGQGHVLVVDDEETVRAVSARLIESLGFQVTLAEDGRDGVQKFERNPAAFDLVLMDLTMPHHDGVQAFSLMRRIRPDVKVILMSGFNEQDAIASFTGKGLAGFLQKPFELATLRDRLRTALEAKA